MNATALAAAVGEARTFARGRDMAAWLGLVPRQMTTGGKPRLLGISKRGNRYLRKNLIHGARAVLPYLVERETPLGRWARGLLARAHKNILVVALANKLGGAGARPHAPMKPGGQRRPEQIARSRRSAALTGCRSLRVVKGRWPDSRTAA
jgi:hypothetical protein